MRYINKVSLEVQEHMDLCRAENASIADGLAYGQWLPITMDAFPTEQVEGSHYETGEVIIEGDIARLPWVLVPNPVLPEEPAEEPEVQP